MAVDEKVSILWVSQEHHNREPLVETLEMEGYTVDRTTRILQTIEMARQKSYSLVLTDLTLAPYEDLDKSGELNDVWKQPVKAKEEIYAHLVAYMVRQIRETGMNKDVPTRIFGHYPEKGIADLSMEPIPIFENRLKIVKDTGAELMNPNNEVYKLKDFLRDVEQIVQQINK